MVIKGRKHDIHSAGPYTANLLICQFFFDNKEFWLSQVGLAIFQTSDFEKKGIFARDR